MPGNIPTGRAKMARSGCKALGLSFKQGGGDNICLFVPLFVLVLVLVLVFVRVLVLGQTR